MRKIRKSRKSVVVVMALLLLISIGYAALTTNLTIGGSATIKKQTFSVYFDNVQVNQSSVSGAKVTTAPTTSGTSTTTINWAVTLDTPGEFYEFNVDIVNGGTMDAMVNTATNNIVSTLTQAQQAYLDYTVTYVNGAAIERYDKLAIGETKTITVRLEFKQDVNPGDLPAEGETGISLSFSEDYVPADGNAVEKVTTVAQVTPPDIGDTITFTTSINGVTLDEWRVLDVEEVGGVSYTYLICNEKVSTDAVVNTTDIDIEDLSDHEDSDGYGITTAYGSLTTAKNTFVPALQNQTNWAPLITNGSLNGHSVTGYAIGSPTLEMFVNSWNKSFPSNTISTHSVSCSNDDDEETVTWTGYEFKFTNSGSWDTYLVLSGISGDKSLYFPVDPDADTPGINYSYWLATQTADEDLTCSMDIDGQTISVGHYYLDHMDTIRPVVCIPTSLVY